MKTGRIIASAAVILVSAVTAFLYVAEQRLEKVDFTPLADLTKARLAGALILPLSQSDLKLGRREFETYSDAYRVADFVLRDHLKPASQGHFKTGQR